MHTILVLGGYGFFGSRICQALVSNQNIHLLIGGRNAARAQALAGKLGLAFSHGLAIDAHSPHLAQRFIELDVRTVIHTAGPFQGQDYAVAQAAIAARAHYIDLADGRDFVAGIEKLDASARMQGVLVTSGASSLPALSSAVVDRYLNRFSRLDAIRHGIGSGARAPGLATMRGVFGYCGKPFSRLTNGQWQTVYGWLDMQRYRFPLSVGSRLLGSCDVPDLILFPERYRGVQTVTFHAGFASSLGHLFVWAASLFARAGLIRSLTPLVVPLRAISQQMEPFVSDKGGMFVSLEGLDREGQPLKLDWHLVAAQNHGPYIPCGASIALANKLARGDKLPYGAMPCMGLLTVDEYLAALQGYDLRELPGMNIYFIVKCLHIMSATVLFGTGIGIAFFKWMTDRSRDIRAIRIVNERTVLADWIFTTPAVILQPITGFGLIYIGGYSVVSGWIVLATCLYLFAGCCWLPVLWLQWRMRDMARTADSDNTQLPPRYWRYAQIWFWLGVPAFGALVLVYWLMVFKPVL